jgi:plasmid stability protein
VGQDLLIDLDDEDVQSLQQLAESNGHTLEEEARLILARAVSEQRQACRCPAFSQQN